MPGGRNPPRRPRVTPTRMSRARGRRAAFATSQLLQQRRREHDVAATSALALCDMQDHSVTVDVRRPGAAVPLRLAARRRSTW